MTDPVNLCIIADPGAFRDELIAELREAGYVVSSADSGPIGLDVVRENQPQIVVCDWHVSGQTGPEICRMLQADADAAHSYVILLAGRYDCQRYSEGLAAGADDLVAKDRPVDELIGRIRVGVRMWHLQRNLKQAAITDGLTGLYNHAHFVNVLDSEFARSRRYGGRLSLILIDLDNFKAVNDTYGHQVGDAVLKQVAQTLQHEVREADLVVRYGGEEFVVIAPEATLHQAEELAERLRRRIAEQTGPDEMHGNTITASLGVASDEDSRVATPSDLLMLCDQAMYAAKRAGRNRVVAAAALPDACTINGRDGSEIEQLRRQVASLSTQAKEAYVQSIWALVQALEARDKYTARHSQNVTFFAEQIARQLDLSPALVRSIRLAAMLHDIGKIGVPDRILMKPGALDEQERAALRRVPQLSASIVDHMRILQAELPMIRHQRENYDGSGYPLGLAGDQIPVGARILMVADAFDALTTDRVFRPSRSIGDALAELRRHSGTQFDPQIVEALADCLTKDGPRWFECIESSRRALDGDCDAACVNTINE